MKATWHLYTTDLLKQILVCSAAVRVAYFYASMLKDSTACYEKSQGKIKRTESTIKNQQVKEKKRRIYKPKHVSLSGVYTAHCPPVRTKKRKKKNRGRKAKRKGNKKRIQPNSQHLLLFFWFLDMHTYSQVHKYFNINKEEIWKKNKKKQ